MSFATIPVFIFCTPIFLFNCISLVDCRLCDQKYVEALQTVVDLFYMPLGTSVSRDAAMGQTTDWDHIQARQPGGSFSSAAQYSPPVRQGSYRTLGCKLLIEE